jgi:hypothetical protein
MGNRTLAVLAFGILCTLPVLSQEQASGKVIKIPPERGVYYDGPAGLVALPTQLFMPLQQSRLREFLGFGAAKLLAVMPGAYAAVAVRTPRPAFYLRGDRSGNRIFLLRASQKEDRREFQAIRESSINEWMRFRAQDLTEVEVEPVFRDLVRINPRADLSPGEYAIVAVLEPRYRAIRLAFDFGVVAARQ